MKPVGVLGEAWQAAGAYVAGHSRQPLSNERGTQNPVKATFWSWFSRKRPDSFSGYSLLAWKWNTHRRPACHAVFVSVYCIGFLLSSRFDLQADCLFS